MSSYFIRRILSVVPTLLLLSILIFIGMELTPGDAASFLLDPDIPPGDMEALREAMGLNRPAHVRYFVWMKEILRGNLGYSLIDGSSITRALARKVPATLELMSLALVISTVLGILLGSISALRRYSALDHTLTVAGMVGLSVPNFFVGLLAIYVFSIQLAIFPVGGRLDPFDTRLITRLSYITLPALILGLVLTAGLMRYTRSTLIDVLMRDYITTARSKGLPEWRINFIHGLRTALTPIVVMLAFRLPMLLGGSVIIESVFAWPGMGSYFLDAVRARDYNIVMVVALLMSSAVLFASLLIDIITALMDPRVRYD